MKRFISIMAPLLCVLTAACADLKTAKNAYQSGDYATARTHLTELSDRGFPEAQTKLGEMALAGQGVQANPKEAIRLFRLAVGQNDSGAMLALGKAYKDGNGVPVNKTKARSLFGRALALGNVHSHYQLGMLEAEQNNIAAAEGHFVKALQAGDTKAWYQSGLLAERAKKMDTAAKYFNNAVAAGDTQAYYRLGKLHLAQGKFLIAEADFKKALEVGDAQAHFQLGTLHESTQQKDLAIEDFKKAAEGGNREAWRHLGDLYLAQNKPDLAEKAFKRGVAVGDSAIYYKLGNLHKDGGNNALAEADLAKAAQINSNAYIPLADAQRAMGKFDTAYGNYKKALSAGNHKAFVKIAEMYRKGEGRPVSEVEALSWLYKARKAGVVGLSTKIAHLERKLQPEGISKAYDLAESNIK